MSLRELAVKHLESMAQPVLSQRDTPRAVPAGQTGSIPYSSKDCAVPAKQFSGTTQVRQYEALGQSVPLGQCESGGTTGTVGTSGTDGTSRTNLVADWGRLQRAADRRNIQALRSGITDRWCTCGRLARLAWPDGARREVWRCDDCAPSMGRA